MLQLFYDKDSEMRLCDVYFSNVRHIFFIFLITKYIARAEDNTRLHLKVSILFCNYNFALEIPSFQRYA